MLMDSPAFFDIAFALIPIALVIAAALGFMILIWVVYTIVWKGVKRGLEEYYGPGEYRGYSAPEPRESATEASAPTDRRYRTGRLTR
jgi:hypothetical protein